MNDIIKRKIMFITGTRADYGKLKTLMRKLDDSPYFSVYVFVCGMHLSETFGYTYREVEKDSYEHIYVAYGLSQTQDHSVNLGNTVIHLAGYVENIQPDIIIVHGDRMDALAGTLVGAMHNILVGHIEGGEVSGTIDESIRHARSKFAHVHFVCNEEARMRLLQMGEEDNRIFVIGSPDIDVMMSSNLPSYKDAKTRYDITFEKYAILMYHPVTTEYDTIGRRIHTVVDAVLASNLNYIVVYPNSDLGSEVILNEYNRLRDNDSFKIFPSLRFEYFLVLLKNAEFILGNSSVGIRESGIYGIPSIDIGSRQSGRYDVSVIKNIRHIEEDYQQILDAITNANNLKYTSNVFGQGNSTDKFMQVISSNDFWTINIQKHFIDRPV